MPKTQERLINPNTMLIDRFGVSLVIMTRDPTTSDKDYADATIWLNKTDSTVWICQNAALGQWSRFSGTPSYETVTTTDATPTNIVSVEMDAGDMLTISGLLWGLKSDSTEGLGCRFFAVARRDTGNVTLVGPALIDYNEDSSGAPSVTIEADTVNQQINIVVTGEAGKTIVWETDYDYYLVGETPGITTVQTTDATPTDLLSVAVSNGQIITFEGEVRGLRDDYTEGVGARLFATARRGSAGNISMIGTPIVDYNEDSSGSPSVSMEADTGTNTLDVIVTGEAAKTYNWEINYNYFLS